MNSKEIKIQDKTIKLGTNENTSGENGMIRYDGSTFKGYTNNKWINFNQDIFNALVAYPYKSEVFQIYNISNV